MKPTTKRLGRQIEDGNWEQYKTKLQKICFYCHFMLNKQKNIY